MPPDSPNPVERYEVTANPQTGQPEMVPSPNPLGGGYVRFEDHQKALQAEVEKREEVEREFDEATQELAVELIDARREAEAAESKLSSAVGALQKELADDAETWRLGDYFRGRQSAFETALQLLRDKGTEQGGGDLGEYDPAYDVPINRSLPSKSEERDDH